MPHLHLPMDHTDADLVLAANVAEVVGSEDLYVAWSHESGPGALPEVEAVVRPEPAPVSPFAEVIVSVMAGLAAFWQALTSRPVADAPKTEHRGDPAPETSAP